MPVQHNHCGSDQTGGNRQQQNHLLRSNRRGQHRDQQARERLRQVVEQCDDADGLAEVLGRNDLLAEGAEVDVEHFVETDNQQETDDVASVFGLRAVMKAPTAISV